VFLAGCMAAAAAIVLGLRWLSLRESRTRPSP
jgi:hypothetical protein